MSDSDSGYGTDELLRAFGHSSSEDEDGDGDEEAVGGRGRGGEEAMAGFSRYTQLHANLRHLLA